MPADDPSLMSRWSALVKSEDYWAIWLGVALVGAALAVFLPRPPQRMAETIAEANTQLAEQARLAPFRTVAWHEAADAKQSLKATSGNLAAFVKRFTGKPRKWTTNPRDSFWVSDVQASAQRASLEEQVAQARTQAERLKAEAQSAQHAARSSSFADPQRNAAAETAIGKWRHAELSEATAAEKAKAAKAFDQVTPLIGLGFALALLFGIALRCTGMSLRKFAAGFLGVYLLAVLAQFLDAQSNLHDAGLGYAAWAILIGLLISNTIGTPAWIRPALQTEFFIKTGLVLLGAEVLLGKILAIGVPGIFVAWVVTPIVLVATYAFGQQVLKIPSKTLNITISADMSVCGVSAAIATAAACRAKKEELTLAVGLSLVFTSVMMVAMPALIRALGMPEVLGGAWIGGTIDATGAVVAAGEFLGDRALYVAATVKMIQNILIGVIAFSVAVYWSVAVERQAGREIGIGEIWYRFPKFVLGFVGMSLVFSLLYAYLGPDVGYTLIDNGVIAGMTANLRNWFFCLAFASIGLTTDFRVLGHYCKGGKPLILYVCGQLLNLGLTLLMAYLMFYVVFPQVTAKL